MVGKSDCFILKSAKKEQHSFECCSFFIIIAFQIVIFTIVLYIPFFEFSWGYSKPCAKIIFKNSSGNRISKINFLTIIYSIDIYTAKPYNINRKNK